MDRSRVFRWTIAAGGIASAALTWICVARAGYTVTQTVYVNPEIRQAYGALGSARNSSDPDELIGCFVTAQPGHASGECHATSNAGNTGTASTGECETVDPNILAGIRTIKGDSSVYFSWDEGGSCNALYVDNYSYLSGKNP